MAISGASDPAANRAFLPGMRLHEGASGLGVMLERGRYRARLVQSQSDVRACQRLRASAFGRNTPLDEDGFDPSFDHVVIEIAGTTEPMACFRLLRVDARTLHLSYTSQFYDTSPLRRVNVPMLEVGRFCTVPNLGDPDVLRLAWASISAIVVREKIGFLFGCSSFPGIDPAPHLSAFAKLQASHLGPQSHRPGVKSSETVAFAGISQPTAPQRNVMRSLPPLLRGYLRMGGWVGDHAVIDRDLGTLHVFTALDPLAIPEPRRKVLQAMI